MPDWNVLRRQLGLEGEPGSLVHDPQARAAVQQLLDDLNAELGSWERIKYFELLPHDFSEDRGEITPTLKVKRRVVQERYREQIEDMYSTKVRPAEAAH